MLLWYFPNKFRMLTSGKTISTTNSKMLFYVSLALYGAWIKDLGWRPLPGRSL